MNEISIAIDSSVQADRSVSLWRSIATTFAIATPLIATRILRAIGGFLCVAMLARLGHVAVAASALVMATVNTLLLIAWSLFYAVAVMVSRAHGARTTATIGSIVDAGFLLGLIVGIPLSVLLWHAKYILVLFHQQTELIMLADAYFRILAWGVLPSLWLVCLDEFFIGIARPRVVIVFACCFVALNILLAYVLLYGKFGLPELGFVGVAYAVTISYWLTFFSILVFICLTKAYRKYRLLRFSVVAGLVFLRQIVALGWPISMQLGAVSLSYSLLAYMIGWCGEGSLIAHQIASQFDMLVIMIPYGMAQATGVLVAQVIGRGEMAQGTGYKKMASLIRLCLVGILGAGLLVFLFSIVYWLFPEILITFYLSIKTVANRDYMYLAASLLAIMGITQLVDAFGIVTSGALRGFYDTKMPMLCNILSNWFVSLPIGYFLAFVMHLGVRGLYWGFCLGAMVSSALLVKRLRLVMPMNS